MRIVGEGQAMRCMVAMLVMMLGRGAVAAERPNVVLIVSDDQGYGDLGFLPGSEARTPHLDRLAREGVYATSFYVSWPACTPSRGSILTGRYPQRNGSYDMIRNDRVNDGHRYTAEEYAVSPERVLGMDTREVLISDVLKQQGYRTAAIGKWDGGQLRRYLPLQRGFDVFYGFVNTGIDYYTHERYGVPSMYRGNEPTTEDRGTYATQLFEREAVRFLEEHREEPFFLYVAFNAPHSASSLDPAVRGAAQAPEKYKKLYPDSRPMDAAEGGEERASAKRQRQKLEYLAAVSAMDEAVGSILEALEEQGVAERTLVMFLSDNGAGAAGDNGPLRGGKAQMFEGGIRVPFIARLPERIPAGTRCEEFLSTLELFPTIARLAGAELPADVVYDGFDMLPVLAGERASQRREMFWQRRGDQAARVGKYKWVDSQRGGGLFDLERDVSERHDLTSSQPEIAARIKSRFAEWRAEMDAAEPRGPFRDY